MKKDATVIRNYADEKTGAKVNVYLAEATTGRGKDKKVLWSGEYHEPMDLEDGIAMDGEDTVIKTWKSERYTNFLDAKRREATTNSIPKELLGKVREVWKSGDATKINALASLLGLSEAELGLIAE